jgi:tRNA-intron endonuclease, archaea type
MVINRAIVFKSTLKILGIFKNNSSRISIMAKTKSKSKKVAKEAAEPETSSAQKKKETKVSETKTKKKVVNSILAGERVLTESSDEAREFYNQSRFGTIAGDGKVELSLLEALYLFEKGRLNVKSEAGRSIKSESYIKRARKVEPNFWIRYCVFRDMRNRGYIIKTALKFGADFRVYDRGIKPGEDHAKWVVFPVHEGSTLTWHEFSAKNRVAHSTKKRLLMGIVDNEGDVTYYEVRWMRP